METTATHTPFCSGDTQDIKCSQGTVESIQLDTTMNTGIEDK